MFKALHHNKPTQTVKFFGIYTEKAKNKNKNKNLTGAHVHDHAQVG